MNAKELLQTYLSSIQNAEAAAALFADDGVIELPTVMAVVLTLEIVSGLLLLTNSYALLATTFVAPVIVNILLFHIFMAPAGLPIAAIVAALWVVSAYPYRALLSPLFQRRFDGVERAESLVSPRSSIARSA